MKPICLNKKQRESHIIFVDARSQGNHTSLVETTSCVHETGCVTLRYALIVDGRPERSASSTDAIPHLYLKSNQNAWLLLVDLASRMFVQQFYLIRNRNGKTYCAWRPVTFWRGGNCSGHNTFTVNLLYDMGGSASKSLRTNFCTRWSRVITHPDHLTSWNRAPPLLPLIPLDEVIVRSGSFWQKENLFAIPSKELRHVKKPAGIPKWRIIVL